MSILDDFQNSAGMFGITAMSGERKLARTLGPALAGVMGAQVRANADVVGAQTGARAMTDTAGIKDAGDTLRQKLINNAQLAITGMREAGAGARNKYSADMGFAGQKYGADSSLTGLKYGQDATSDRQRKKFKFDQDMYDQEALAAWRAGGTGGGSNVAAVTDKLDNRYNEEQSMLQGTGGGGGWGGTVAKPLDDEDSWPW